MRVALLSLALCIFLASPPSAAQADKEEAALRQQIEELRKHAATLRQEFNFPEAERELKKANELEQALHQMHADRASPVEPTKPVLAQPSKAAKSPAAAPLRCAYGEARYTVKTAVGEMDCHLMYNGKGMMRVMNEKDPSIQFVINYPSLKTSILEDEAVNRGKVYDCKYLACDAPPIIDEVGATAAGAKSLGSKDIDGHPCSGWRLDPSQGIHHFQTEMWFAKDLKFPYQYTWALAEQPSKKVNWTLAVFTATPRTFVFDLTGYRKAGYAWATDPWFRWLAN